MAINSFEMITAVIYFETGHLCQSIIMLDITRMDHIGKTEPISITDI